MKPSKAPQPGCAVKIPRAPKNARIKGAEFLAGVSLLIGGMEVAVAVPIVQTKTQIATSAMSSTLGGWTQFNGSLGTLDSVTIDLSSFQYEGTQNAFLASSQYPKFSQSTLSFSVASFGDINSAFQNFDVSVPTTEIKNIEKFQTLSSGLAGSNWIGVSTFDLVATINTQCYGPNEVLIDCNNQDLGYWQGQFILTYEYTAPTPPPPGPSIPEPAGLALTGLGLAMLGVQRRRKAAKS